MFIPDPQNEDDFSEAYFIDIDKLKKISITHDASIRFDFYKEGGDPIIIGPYEDPRFAIRDIQEKINEEKERDLKIKIKIAEEKVKELKEMIVECPYCGMLYDRKETNNERWDGPPLFEDEM